jgi:hypothetical protein
MRWGVAALLVMQPLLSSYTALGKNKLAGAIVIVSDAVGVVAALLWPANPLVSAAVGYLVANSIKMLSLILLIRSAFLEPLARLSAGGQR